MGSVLLAVESITSKSSLSRWCLVAHGDVGQAKWVEYWGCVESSGDGDVSGLRF
jgi:hypothetical protein